MPSSYYKPSLLFYLMTLLKKNLGIPIKEILGSNRWVGEKSTLELSPTSRQTLSPTLKDQGGVSPVKRPGFGNEFSKVSYQPPCNSFNKYSEPISLLKIQFQTNKL